MGYGMQFKNPEALLDGMARDGREFGHLTENLRDALLNGAQAVEFGIAGLEDQTRTCVARRYIADDGTGMDEDTLTTAYANVGETGTSHDFDVTLAEDGAVSVETVEVGALDQRHMRRGIGGRASLSRWNPLGVVTVTVHEGVARTTWMFRTIEGQIQMREWSDEGKRTIFVDPYEEPAVLTYDDIMVDKPFSRSLLVRSGVVANQDEADDLIAEMDEEDVIDNPFAGTDWADVLPDWLVASWDDDGLAYRADGALAHGTIKVLLGEHPWSSTAITGDPDFPNEAIPTKYNGAINASWLDLRPWDVRVWTMVDETRVKDTSRPLHLWYDIKGYSERYHLDSGQPRKTASPSGRRQLGALAQRTREELVDLVEVIDLGKYGQALVVVAKHKDAINAKTGKPIGVSGGYDATRRDGMVAVVYGNELHGLGDNDKLQPEDYQYRNMGVPTSNAFHRRVSIILFMPRATDTTEGVFQAFARDSIKWSGLDRLPLGGEHGVNNAVTNSLPEALHALAHVDGAVDEDYVVDQKRYQHLKSLLRLDPATAGGSAASKSTSTSDGPGLVETKNGTEPGTAAGPHGEPGEERQPCPECGLKIHAPDCSLKPATTGGGSTRGKLHRLRPDEKGLLTGRKSRARVKSPDDETETVSLDPPFVEFLDSPVEADDGRWPVSWDKGKLGPKTGTINVYRHHAAIEALFKAARKAKRQDDETDVFARRWISRRLSDGLMGTLALAEIKLDHRTKGKLDQFKLDDLASQLTHKEWWVVLVASMLADQESLIAYIRANAAAAKKSSSAA